MRPFVLIILSFLMLTSCNNLNIFQVTGNSKNNDSFKMLGENPTHILAPDDKLSLSIWNHDDLSIGSVFSIYNTNESFGKWILIEADSTATLPYTGSIKLGGLTLDEAEVLITEKMAEHINQPIVEVRVLNREVTILGEVKAPGNYLLEKEKNTLIEYLGVAQGLGFYADSKRIQVIRNEVSYTIDLTKLTSFEQKNIYLQSRDIIYVPSKKSKKIDMKAPVLIPFASVLTSVGVLISVFSK